MKLQEILEILQGFAPLQLAEDFDNVGLLVGDKETKINKILVTLDTTLQVLDEAIENHSNLIVSFHPIIFSGLKSITGKNYVEKIIRKAIQNNIAIYSMHTALDNLAYGVSDRMIQQLGIQRSTVLMPKLNQLKKIVTYVPKQKLKEVFDSLANAGAGNIGNYSHCSFQHEGIGTFLPQKNSNPYLGGKGEIHNEPETQLNMVFQAHKESEIICSLFQSHPYETPAFEIYSLNNQKNEIGMGKIGELEQEMQADEFMRFLKEKMNATQVRHSKLLQKPIKKVSVLGGSGSFAISEAKKQKADVLVTADLKYHNFFEAENKIILMDIGHYESEQFTKKLIVDYLSKKMFNFAILESKVVTNPVYYF